MTTRTINYTSATNNCILSNDLINHNIGKQKLISIRLCLKKLEFWFLNYDFKPFFYSSNAKNVMTYFAIFALLFNIIGIIYT